MNNSKVWAAMIAMLIACAAIAVSQNIIPVDDVNKLPWVIDAKGGALPDMKTLAAPAEAQQPAAAAQPQTLIPLNPAGQGQTNLKTGSALYAKKQLHLDRKTGQTWHAPKDRKNPYVPGQLVIGFKQSARGKYAMSIGKDGVLKTGMASIDALNAKYNATGQKNIHEHLFPAAYRYGLDLHHVIYVDPKLDINAVAAVYRADPNVQFAEPDYIPFLAVAARGDPGTTTADPKQVQGSRPNDTYFDWAPIIMSVDRARTVTNGCGEGGTSDTLLMLDIQQINITHEDISMNIGVTGGTTPTTTTLATQHGHMCTGHALSNINNGVGTCGPAGGNGASGVKVAYYRFTSSSDNATGVTWGISHHACAIAQASLYFTNTEVLEAAFKAALDAGAPAYIAAGNDRSEYNDMYPAFFSCVTAVGGITYNGRHWAWDDTSGSCFGDFVGICAPGDAQWSLNSNSTNGYIDGYGGTSWAAPEVAAIAAACHHATGKTGTDLQSAVLRSALNNDHLNAGLSSLTIPAGAGGTGIANAYEAVTVKDVNASVDFISINSALNNYLNHGDMYLRSCAEPNYDPIDTMMFDNAVFGTPPNGTHGTYQTDRTIVPNVTYYPKAMVHNHGIATVAFNVNCTCPDGYTSTKQVSLASGKGTLVTFDTWSPTGTGATSLQAYADLVGDQNRLNDTCTVNLTKALRDTVYLDDGSYDGGYVDSLAIWATKFTPERPCSLTGVNFFVMNQHTLGTAPAWYCSLKVYDANGVNGAPGSRLYGVVITNALITGGKGWKTFTLPAAQVVSKPVYVCIQQYGAQFNGGTRRDTTTIGFDTRRSSATTYYSVTNGVSWGSLDNDVAIRPVVGYQTVNANDIGVASIDAPSPPYAKGYPMTAMATFTNFGTAAQSNIPVVCHYDSIGATRVTKVTSNKTIASLAPGASTQVAFDPWVPGGSGAAVYAFDVTVRANNTGDSWSGNDSIRTYPDSVRTGVELTAGEGGASYYTTASRVGAVKFTAAAACSLTAGKCMYYRISGTATPSCTCFVWQDSTGYNMPKAMPLSQVVVAAQNTWYATWSTYTYATPVSLPAGDFWVGFTYATASNMSPLMDGAANNGRSYVSSTRGAGSWSLAGDNWLIHAVIKYSSFPNADLGIVSQDAPSSVVKPNFSVIPTTTVTNGGSTVLSNPQVTCTFTDSATGTVAYTQTVTIASIAPQQNIQLAFPVFTPSASVATYWFKTFRVGTDNVAANDRDSMKVYTSTLDEIAYDDGPAFIAITDGGGGTYDSLYHAVRITPQLPCSLVGTWHCLYDSRGPWTKSCSTYVWYRTNGYKNWPSDRYVLSELFTPSSTTRGAKYFRRDVPATFFDAGQDFWIGNWTPRVAAASETLAVVNDYSALSGRSFFRWNPRDSATNGANYAWLPWMGDFCVSALVKYLGGPSLVVKGLVNSVTSSTNLHFHAYLTKNLDQVYDETKPGSALSLLSGSQGLWQFDAKNFWPMWNRGDTLVTVVDYEANSGVITHAGSYAAMNDTLLIGVSTQTTNTAALRAIPVPVATKVGANIRVDWPKPAYDAGKPSINPVIGYHVYRSTNGITFSAIGSKTLYTDTSYTDAGPAGGNTYYYAIKLRYYGSINTKGDPKAVTIESQYTSANSNGILMPLSVEFGQMSAMVNGNDVTINWRTESETNSYQWVIERAESGSDVYTQVATVQAMVNSNSPTNYSYTDRDVPGNTVYIYRLVEVDANGNRAYHGPVSVGPLRGKPLVYALGQAMPNPFRGAAAISYQLRDPGRVSIKVYNISGQLVRTLVNADQEAKYYNVSWDGATDRGEKAAAGIYIYRLDVNGFSAMRKMTCLK